MQVKDIMTDRPACCTPETPLQEVAELMNKYDCGAIPVVEDTESRHAIGVVTDRDIACKTVALGKNPLNMTAGEIMSSPCVTVEPEASVEDCVRTLEEHQIRRAVVVNDDGVCCGIVAQADIALEASDDAAELVREVSFPAAPG